MDYTKTGLIFKIRKALRYVRLYGPSRTIVKIKGQYHMNRTFDSLPACDFDADHDGHVGLLGCGNYAYSNIAYYLEKNYGKVIRGVMDKNIQRAASLCTEYGAAWYTDDEMRVIDDPQIDTIYIASNHATHAEYAILALKADKNVHIEKPHVVSFDQLERLMAAAKQSKGRVLSIGYNRPWSTIGREIKKHISQEEGAAMINWFVAGHELDPDHWYFKPEEGGRILGNLCHWTDFTYNMIDAGSRYPIEIIPARSEKSDCDIAVSYVFGDGSIAAITFSAKGHTFEGVREKLAMHRGNVLISMDDFQNLTVEVIEKKIRTKPLFRDHGHERSIVSSYDVAKDRLATGQDLDYVFETAELFLATRRALESNEKVVLKRP